MEQIEILEVLNEDIYNRISQTRLFKVISDLNCSEQDLNDYINSFHNLIQEKGNEYAKRKLLIVFRINPLLAMRIIDTCSISSDKDSGQYVHDVINALYISITRKKCIRSDLTDINKVVLNDFTTYTIYLIEASLRDTFHIYSIRTNDLLDYVYNEDILLIKLQEKPKYLTDNNLTHIFDNISIRYQFELIFWLWEKHRKTNDYGKYKETYASKKMNMLMNRIKDGELWMHFEANQDLSTIERSCLELERTTLRAIVISVIYEGEHLYYIEKIFGKIKTESKLKKLVDEEIYNEYVSKVFFNNLTT